MTREQEFRRRLYEAHRDRLVADEQWYQEAKGTADRFPASAAEALGLLDDLARTGDLESFKSCTQAWAVKPTTLGFKGTIGQMMLNIFVKRADEPERVARLLVESLRVPASDDEARAKLEALADYSKSIKRGSTPALVNVAFVASYFWGLADHERWPVIWPSAARFVDFLTGEPLPSDPPERYQTFSSQVREISSDNQEFEMTADSWEDQDCLDEVLCDRAEFGRHSAEASEQDLKQNAKALVRLADHWGDWLCEEVSGALEDDLKVSKPKIQQSDGSYRNDFWVDLRSEQGVYLGLRVWLNHRGVAVGLFPGFEPKNLREKIRPVIEAADFQDCEILGGNDSDIGRDVGLTRGGYVYGRWFEREQLAEVRLTETVVEVATLLKPLYGELLSLGLDDEQRVDSADPLEPVVKQFLAESGYPTPDDDAHRAKREEFKALLAPDVSFDRSRISRVWNTGEYGGPGPMPALNASFNDADQEELDRMTDAIRFLCWGEEPAAERIDRMLDDTRFKIKGLGESVIMKLLAIAHPEIYLTVFPYKGDQGKRRMVQLLGMEEATGSEGEVQVASNKALRDRVERFFPNDPWGMGRFLYWHLNEWTKQETEDDRDVLGELADELRIDTAFLERIGSLLKDKGQVIFYGPPGTGKTFLAQKLAEALAPDAGRRAIVQFHPSSSYEDFFEGYRPEEGADG